MDILSDTTVLWLMKAGDNAEVRLEAIAEAIRRGLVRVVPNLNGDEP